MVIILFIFKDLLVLYNINMLHLDYLMISNGGSDPFHYIKGNGGLGYKPSPPFMHGLGYSHDWIDGSGFHMKGRGEFERDEEGKEQWKPYGPQELKDLLEKKGDIIKASDLVNVYWYNEHFGPKNDLVDEEQQRILSLIYKKNLESKVGPHDRKEIDKIIRYQKDINEPHNEYKKVPTVLSYESEKTKDINRIAKSLVPTTIKEKYEKDKQEFVNSILTAVHKGEDIIDLVQNQESELPIDLLFKNSKGKLDAGAFERAIAAIDLDKITDVYGKNKPKEELKRARYDVELKDLNNPELKFIRDALKLTPLQEEINKKISEGYKVKVMSYNTNYDTYYKNKLVFANDPYFKIDTLVDFYFVKNKKGEKSEHNLLIEEKFYSNKKGAINVRQEELPYYSEFNSEVEKKEFNTNRKKIADKLRKLKEEINEINEKTIFYRKNIKYFDEKEIINIKEKINDLQEKINDLQEKRELLKENLSSNEKIKNYIYSKMKPFVGVPVEAGKFPIPIDVFTTKHKAPNISMLKKKAGGTGGNYTLIDGLTSPIINKTGELKTKNINVKTGKKNEVIVSSDLNARQFANRYVVLADAVADGLYFDWIKDNIELENVRTGKSAYGSNKGNTSIMIPYSQQSKGTMNYNKFIDLENKKIKEKELEYEKDKNIIKSLMKKNKKK